mmetsp:Transcript_7081/g.10576  ORF Transcript_7081/g.10576 Transcript_7081/m.10576 type:complete len:248 (+) Transcript_7081:30-773(+)
MLRCTSAKCLRFSIVFLSYIVRVCDASTVSLDWGLGVGDQGTTVVSTGDFVQWVWVDSGIPHSIFAVNGDFSNSDVSSTKGFTHTVQFHTVGTYNYICAVHGTAMKGIISVVASTSSASPSMSPTFFPTVSPTKKPTRSPTVSPTMMPTSHDSQFPSSRPTFSPTAMPTRIPTRLPTKLPSVSPTFSPTLKPTNLPTKVPTNAPISTPTKAPTKEPTKTPTSVKPTLSPTPIPEKLCKCNSVHRSYR